MRFNGIWARRALAVLALLLVAATALADERTREEELEGIRGEIARLQARLGQVRERTVGLAGELERIAVQLDLQEQRVAEAAAAHALAAERGTALEGRVGELESQLEASRQELQGRLLGLYRLGRHGYLRLFLSLRPGESLLPAIRQLRYLARRDAQAVERFLAARTRLEFERDQLAGERRQAEAWLQQEEGRRRDLLRLRARETQLLARAEREGVELAGRATELADKERKLSNFLDFLYGRTASSLGGQPLSSFRGVLDWPLRGKVLERFGPRLDPRYRTRVPHNGIDLETTPGASVRVIFPGKVVYAAPFEGFGQTVVVQHAGRAFTLYAGLTELKVARDDMLSLATVIGLATDRLYFEIRIENRPEDPLVWLR